MTGLAMAIDAAMVMGLVLFFLFANRIFGVLGEHPGDGLLPYETGMPPIEPAVDRMSVTYYRFAVLFVVFDVDLAFLLPWALGRADFGPTQAVAMTVFMALMFLMLAYFWKKGALECR